MLLRVGSVNAIEDALGSSDFDTYVFLVTQTIVE